MDTNNLFTAEECVELINTQLDQQGLPKDFNHRLLRHYIGEGVIPKTIRDGKFAKYNAQHVAAAVALRAQQQLGLSSKAFKTYSQTSPVQSASGALSGLTTSSVYASALNTAKNTNLEAFGSDLLHSQVQPMMSSSFAASTDVAGSIASLQHLVESSVRTEVQERILDTSLQVSSETLNQRARALAALRGTAPSESVSAGAGLKPLSFSDKALAALHGTAPSESVSAGSDLKSLGLPVAPVPMARSLKTSVQPKWIDVDCGAGIRLQIQDDRASSWTANDTQQLANAINLWKDSL